MRLFDVDIDSRGYFRVKKGRTKVELTEFEVLDRYDSKHDSNRSRSRNRGVDVALGVLSEVAVDHPSHALLEIAVDGHLFVVYLFA
jgi:hypothetical protein